MSTFGKKKVTISKKDLDKKVVANNKSLKAKNKVLESSIKDKEKELKSLEKEFSSESKKLGNLYKDIEFQEDRFQSLKGGVYSSDKLLKAKLKAISEAESEFVSMRALLRNLKIKLISLKMT